MFLPTNITLKFGDSGDFVSELQRRLSIVHCFNADAINGFFDGNTVNGVSRFQSMAGIQADGVAGPETLRRLNGSLSGDTSTSSHDAKAEEEERQRQHLAAQQLQREMMVAEQTAQMAQQEAYTAPVVETAAIPETQPQHHHSQHPQPVTEPAYAQPQQPLHHQHPTPQAAPSAGDILAQMLMAPQHPVQPQQPAPQHHIPPEVTQPQHQAHQHQHHQPQQPQPAPPVVQQQTYIQPEQQSYIPPQPAPVQQAQPQPQQYQAQPYQPQQHYAPPQQHAPIPQQHTPAPQPQPYAAQPQQYVPPQQQQAVAQTPAPAPEPSRSMVGRAMQYANEMVQKLATYFEAKLPNHVISEVKQIGHAMASSGVKEVPIPTGPEQQQQRGIEQQRGQQQGKQIG